MKYNQPYGISDPNASYINGDPSIGLQGSIPPALSIEGPQRELHNFILKSGFTPSDTDMLQLIRSVRKAAVNFAVDTGTVNQMVVTLDPPLESYYAGMPLRVLVAVSSTGPATVNVNSLGPRNIKLTTGANVGVNDLTAGMIAYLIDDGTNFELVSKGGAVTGSTTTIGIPYAADTGTVNAILAVYSPALTSIAEGAFVSVKVMNAITGPCTFQPNALPALPIFRDDGTPMAKGDLWVQETILLENHSTYYQMLKPVPSQFRIKLGADLTLYCRTDGNDNNNGSANTSAAAFLTPAAALNYARTAFDIAGRQVTIQLGITGSYNANGTVLGSTAGTLRLRGDPVAQDSYILNTSDVNGLNAGPGTSILTGVKVVQSSNANNVCSAGSGSDLHISSCSFACSAGAGTQNSLLLSFPGGNIAIDGNIKFASNAAFCLSSIGGSIYAASTPGSVLSAASAITFTTVVQAGNQGLIYFTPSMYSWAGSFSGNRYFATLNGVVNSNGGGANYFPGTVAGTVSQGGQYN